jgi:riboflavin kinase/FMN adenylyltransferase
MKVLQGLAGLRQLTEGCVMSIGNFDGMHLGHARLLSRMRELRQANGGATQLAVVTFEPHPLTVLRPQNVPPRLTPPSVKRQLLEAAGVDALVELPPAREVLDLTAEEFWQILRDEVQPSHVVEGGSFNFGKDRGGTIEKLREWSARTAIQLHVIDSVKVVLVDMLVVPVSSSIIRWLLTNGRVRDAAICFGRPYALDGTVVEGAKRGRELGIPTANLSCLDQLIPADGIYAGRCAFDGDIWPAAVSIGTNPTFGPNPRTVEPHLIGFAGDLYGRTLRLELLDWLRDQETFPDVESLKSRIAQDIQETLDRATRDPARPIAQVALSNVSQHLSKQSLP